MLGGCVKFKSSEKSTSNSTEKNDLQNILFTIKKKGYQIFKLRKCIILKMLNCKLMTATDL